jgi:hypothetical protein
VQARALEGLQGQARTVAAGMRRRATLRRVSPKQRAGGDTWADSLLHRYASPRYDHLLAQGVSSATGGIAGSCRHLITDRMEFTGARWRLQRAEAVLKLRPLRSSGDFEASWRVHKQQERQRNHLSYSAEPLFLDAD